jgi:hypothetical protein
MDGHGFFQDLHGKDVGFFGGNRETIGKNMINMGNLGFFMAIFVKKYAMASPQP